MIQLASSSTLSIIGQGAGIIFQSDGSNRVLELNGNVVLENLAIEGGKVQASSKATAEGGGLLIDDGNVTLINVSVSNNSAQGANGATGTGAKGGSNSGPNGGMGTDAYGGGIYLASGTLSLINCNVNNNKAIGGDGGEGGHGQGSTPTAGAGANGGSGGDGGEAHGGGIFVARTATQLTVRQSQIDNNIAQGGVGGMGGDGTWGRWMGGTAGSGGAGGAASGGGLAVSSSGTLTFLSPTIDFNRAQGGLGGAPGKGGHGGSNNGPNGPAGPGGAASGGGLAVCSSGTLTLLSPIIESNLAQGGQGGAVGQGGWANNNDDTGGAGGAATGGGLWGTGAIEFAAVNACVQSNQAIGGQGGSGGLMIGWANGPGPTGSYGGQGGAGEDATGGGIYLGAGTDVSLFGGQVSRNLATGGNGASGRNGNPGCQGVGGYGGAGGLGGDGGDVYGGGIYIDGSAATVLDVEISGNKAAGGKGGNGGNGAVGGNGSALLTGPCGGGGGGGDRSNSGNSRGGVPAGCGSGGSATGGGCYVSSTHLQLGNCTVNANTASGGSGGTGGIGGLGGNGGQQGGNGGCGGFGSPGGAGCGGGIAVDNGGSLSVFDGTVSSDVAIGGSGGIGANGNNGGNGGDWDGTDTVAGGGGGGGNGGRGGNGGDASGGGIFVSSNASASTFGTAVSGTLQAGRAGSPGTPGTGGKGGEGGDNSVVSLNGPNGAPGDAGTPGTDGTQNGPDIYGNVTSSAPPTATQMALSPMPPSVVAGVPFPYPLYAVAEDADGNLAGSFNSSVQIASGPGANPLLSGTLTVAATSGVAVFSNLSATDGGNFTLQATGGGVQGTTNNFQVIGYTPAQIRTAYGINNLGNGANDQPLDGTGQTIAIVVAYDDPNIFQDVDSFDQQFGLSNSVPTLYDEYGAASSFLTVMNQDGQASPLPGQDQGDPTATPPVPPGVWEGEEIMDVEWAHAIAPGAKIDVVECNSDGNADYFSGARAAAALSGVSVVSMSFGTTEGTGAGQVTASAEAMYDTYFTTPSNHQGVTFLAATGDAETGDLGINDASYPAFSPNVVAVGGTSLTINADGSYDSETGWSRSGGGLSQFEPEPPYQSAVQTTGQRAIPDVAFMGDPNTGAAVLDSYSSSASDPWATVAGTSLGTPCWAGLIAIVNQGRVADGKGTLNSGNDPTQTLTALYSPLLSGDFNPSDDFDNNVGNNGTTTAGLTDRSLYNEVTGLGSPVANRLVPDMINFACAVSQVSPSRGLATAGTMVTITGAGFDGATKVSFGAVAASSFTVNSDNQITATSPGGTGTVHVTVTTEDGTSATSTADQFTYVAAVSLSNSTVVLSKGSIALNSTAKVTLVARDANGNQEPSGGLTVAFGLGTGSTGGNFSTVTDNGNGTYSATFTGTKAGSDTITATIGGKPVTYTPPTVTVVGPASMSQSTVTLSASSVAAGSTLTVTLTARDALGHQEPSGGLTVAFGLGTGSAGGNFGTVTDNGNGTYIATFTGTKAGSDTITATIGGNAVTYKPPTVTVVGPASMSQSTVTLSASSVAAGSTITVTLTARDALGHQEPSGGLKVAFGLGSGAAGGTFSPVPATDHGNGTYTATFTATVAGKNTITATIGSVAVTSAAPSVTVVPGAVSLAKSTLAVSASQVTSGSTATVTLVARDAYGNQESTGGLKVTFGLGTGTAQGAFGPVTDKKNGTYTATFTATIAGSNTITATITTTSGKQAVASKLPTVIVVPGVFSRSKSTITVLPSKIAPGGTATVTLTARDANGNQEPTGGLTVVFKASGSAGKIGAVTDNNNGTYTATFTGTTTGSDTITATINGQSITSTPPTVTVSTTGAGITTAQSPDTAPANGLAIDAALRALLLDDSTVTSKPHPLFDT